MSFLFCAYRYYLAHSTMPCIYSSLLCMPCIDCFACPVLIASCMPSGCIDRAFSQHSPISAFFCRAFFEMIQSLVIITNPRFIQRSSWRLRRLIRRAYCSHILAKMIHMYIYVYDRAYDCAMEFSLLIFCGVAKMIHMCICI